MNAHIKHILLILVIVLFYSCGVQKGITFTQMIAIDTNSKDTIPIEGISLHKGKSCFFITTLYDQPLPTLEIFNQENRYNFITPTQKSGLSGSYSDSYQTDTIIRNQLLVITAVKAAIKKKLSGCEFVYIDSEQFNKNNLSKEKILDTYHPEYLIELTKLEFHITGNLQRMAIVSSSSQHRAAFKSIRIRPHAHFNGNILISYDALWTIHYVREGVQKMVKQKGGLFSDYFTYYDLNDHIYKTARQAGMDFRSILLYD